MLYDKIKKIAKENNISIYRIERDLGVSISDLMEE